MKKLIIKIVLFLLPVIIFAIGLEIIVESIPNSYSYKSNYMTSHAKEIKTLVLGSSNAYDGICPAELPSGFNLANSGQALEDDYRLLSMHIDSMDSLKMVILALGYHSLRSSQTMSRRLYYTIYMHLYSRWPLSQYSFEAYDMQHALLKIKEYIQTDDIARCDSLGQRLYYEGIVDKNGKRDMQIDFLSHHDSFDITEKKDVIDSCANYLHLIDSICQTHNVQLVIVQMPVLQQYKAQLPIEQVMVQDSLLSSFHSSAIYINASEWSLTSEDCYNATHISKEKSISFTRKLYECIVSTTR